MQKVGFSHVNTAYHFEKRPIWYASSRLWSDSQSRNDGKRFRKSERNSCISSLWRHARIIALFGWQTKIYCGFDLILLLCPSNFLKIFALGDSSALSKDFLFHAFDVLVIFSVLKTCSLNNCVFQPDILPMIILLQSFLLDFDCRYHDFE